MATLTITTEIIGLSIGLATPVTGGLWWFFKYYKEQIERGLRSEFRHEIDRIVTEQNHIACHLEQTSPGYERLQVSGEYRSIFYQDCSIPPTRRFNDR